MEEKDPAELSHGKVRPGIPKKTHHFCSLLPLEFFTILNQRWEDFLDSKNCIKLSNDGL
jgi:hypothetical protein